MTIHHPQALNEIGDRHNNEDSIFPPLGKATTTNRLFLVCDGVGGQDKGELASQIICKTFPKFFFDQKQENNATALLQGSLQYAEENIRSYLRENEGSDGMASTLTVMYFVNNQVVIGWVGDSRIYQIRNGKIIYQTKDHSLVQSLVDMGEISVDEVKDHPQKNVIERSVNGRDPARMDIVTLTDIEEGDFFLMCTDGMLETLDDSFINNWMHFNESVEEIKHKMFLNANGKTQDNFSMYLIKVDSVEQSDDIEKMPTYSKTWNKNKIWKGKGAINFP